MHAGARPRAPDPEANEPKVPGEIDDADTEPSKVDDGVEGLPKPK